ncbi:MAG TPA: NTF2 fold immunity protein [Trebonia sp.]
MRIAVAWALSAAVLASTPLRVSGQPAPGDAPPDGFVPDSATAVRIAIAVWTPIYGAAQIARERPYRARLRGGVWTVEGSLPGCRRVPEGRCVGVGGVALAEIAQADARVLRVAHGR